MTRRTACLALLAVMMLAGVAMHRAEAKYVAIFTQDGPDVIEVGGGTLDVTDLMVVSRGLSRSFVSGASGAYVSGTPGDLGRAYVGSINGPATFGSGLIFTTTESSGDPVGFSASASFVFVPDDYVSGAPLSETSTYADATFASLGITPGTYVYSWGSDAHADTLTIEIGSPIPEPSTWAMGLIGFAGLGYASYRRARGGKAAQSVA
jgi:hypothetical protein